MVPTRSLHSFLQVGKSLSKHSLRYLWERALEELRTKFGTIFWTGLFRLRCSLKGIHVGSQVEVYGPIILRSPNAGVSIGNRVQFISSSWRSSFSAISGPVRLRTFLPTARIIFEEGSGLGGGGSVSARSQTIRIGKNSIFGPDCILCDSDFHNPWPPERRGQFDGTDRDRGIDIGANVWVGARVIILKGVSIGDNSVIASGSVISKSVPANCLAAGNPAEVKKYFV